MYQTRLITNVGLAIVLLAGSLLGQDGVGAAKRFKAMLGAASGMSQASSPFKLISTAESRQREVFGGELRNASFETLLYNDNVGGILVRNEPLNKNDRLKLDYLTFTLDESANPPTVTIRLGANGIKDEFTVEASLLVVAARVAAGDQLVLLTLAARAKENEKLGIRDAKERLGIHNGISGHKLALNATILDDSLMRVAFLNQIALQEAGLEGDELSEKLPEYYILTEKEWTLSAKAFNNRQVLYDVVSRKGKETRPGLGATWTELLNPRQKGALAQLSSFIATYRLVNAAAEGYLVDFPEAEFLKLLQKVSPLSKKQALSEADVDDMTKLLDQTPNQKFLEMVSDLENRK